MAKLSAELDLALLLDVKIVLPEALEIELEEHWIRNLDKKYIGVNRGVKDLTNYLIERSPEGVKVTVPDKEKILETYRSRLLRSKISGTSTL